MARNISQNEINLAGNTVPRSVRLTNFKGGGSVINVTLVTNTDLWTKNGDKFEATDTKPEYHNIVIKGGSEALANILKQKSLFCQVRGRLQYREWNREIKQQDDKGVWNILYDQGGQPVIQKTTVAEIIVAGPAHYFSITPCVNRQDNGRSAPPPDKADIYPADAPDFGGGVGPSESIDQVPW